MDKNLYADQQTGALKWKFVSEGPVVSSPALAGGIGPLELFSFFSRGVDGAVDFGSGDGGVHALDAVSGCLKWKFKTGDDAEIHNHVGIHP